MIFIHFKKTNSGPSVVVYACKLSNHRRILSSGSSWAIYTYILSTKQNYNKLNREIYYSLFLAHEWEEFQGIILKWGFWSKTNPYNSLLCSFLIMRHLFIRAFSKSHLLLTFLTSTFNLLILFLHQYCQVVKISIKN